MNMRRMYRELVHAVYFQRHPFEAVRYVRSKWIFKHHAVETAEDLLRAIDINDPNAFEGWERYSRLIMSMEEWASIGYEQRRFLYGLTRAMKPHNVIETGVARGVSTSCILAALIENGSGSLWSIDLPPEEWGSHRQPDGGRYDWTDAGVGSAIPDSFLIQMDDRFTLILEDVRTALPTTLETLPGPVDIFFHDDLHTPDHMLWEYELVWPHVRPSGVLVSDDINHSWLQWATTESGRAKGTVNLGRLGVLRK